MYDKIDSMYADIEDSMPGWHRTDLSPSLTPPVAHTGYCTQQSFDKSMLAFQKSVENKIRPQIVFVDGWDAHFSPILRAMRADNIFVFFLSVSGSGKAAEKLLRVEEKLPPCLQQRLQRARDTARQMTMQQQERAKQQLISDLEKEPTDAAAYRSFDKMKASRLRLALPAIAGRHVAANTAHTSDTSLRELPGQHRHAGRARRRWCSPSDIPGQNHAAPPAGERRVAAAQFQE
jgi:hypothetical protein